jgi:hypothetical protein
MTLAALYCDSSNLVSNVIVTPSAPFFTTSGLTVSWSSSSVADAGAYTIVLTTTLTRAGTFSVT